MKANDKSYELDHFFRICGNLLQIVREHSQCTMKRIDIMRKGKFFKGVIVSQGLL